MQTSSAEATRIAERMIRCAEHNATFYASYPHNWTAVEVLHALAAHFHRRGHVHPPFETIDLVPAATSLPLRQAASTRRAA